MQSKFEEVAEIKADYEFLIKQQKNKVKASQLKEQRDLEIRNK